MNRTVFIDLALFVFDVRKNFEMLEFSEMDSTRFRNGKDFDRFMTGTDFVMLFFF